MGADMSFLWPFGVVLTNLGLLGAGLAFFSSFFFPSPHFGLSFFLFYYSIYSL